MFPATFRGYVLFTALVEAAYFNAWPFWSFKDANRGTLFERAVALRHNVAQRHVLIGYALRWFAILIGLLMTMDVAEHSMALSDGFRTMWLSLTVCAGMSVALAAVMLFEILIVYTFLARAEVPAPAADYKRYK